MAVHVSSDCETTMSIDIVGNSNFVAMYRQFTS